MDGNGRWAKARGLPRALGHERGVEALRRCVNAAPGLGVTHLTVFSFSTENWSRPADEVLALFALLRAYVSRDLERLHKEGVRIRVIGLREGVPADIVSLIEIAEARTRNNTALQLTIAFNYGGRAEIVRAAQRLAERVARGELSPDAIDEAAFASELNTAGLPEIDLLIRTSGEFRISNFMLWQLAYAEMVFLPTLWPEFGAADLAEAVAIYAARDRRFGAVSGGKA
jgi:undecaprenyl diphosphate synthase